MNIVLWVLQVALALLCISGGAYQIFMLDELQKGVAAMRQLPRRLWVFFGVFGCVGGLCLILPLAGVTPVAAAAVALQSALITALYLRHGDRAPMPYSAAMLVMAVFIAYGRFELRPL
jgi:hypothetical protein